MSRLDGADAETLREIIDKVQEELLKRAKTLGETAERLNREVMERHPDRDHASSVRYSAYANEAQAAYGLVRRIVEGQW